MIPRLSLSLLKANLRRPPELWYEMLTVTTLRDKKHQRELGSNLTSSEDIILVFNRKKCWARQVDHPFNGIGNNGQ